MPPTDPTLPEALPQRPALPPAPRSVPFLLRWVLLLNAPQTGFGFAFLGISLGILVALTSPAEVVQDLLTRFDIELAEGAVVSTHNTEMKFNEQPVWRVTAEVSTDDGPPLTVVSYTVDTPPATGDRVPVRRSRQLPSMAVISGMTTAKVPSFVVLWIGVFVVMGMVSVVLRVRRGWELVQLLATGEQAKGRLVSMEETKQRVGNRQVQLLCFHFDDAQGDTWPTEVRTIRPERLEDEATEQVLYLPERPMVSTVVDHLPSWLELGEAGWQPPPLSAVFTAGQKLAFVALGVFIGQLLSLKHS